MSDDLKPCPFCGGKALVGQTLDDAWYAMCEVDHCCKIESYWRTKDEAIAAWNTRFVPRVTGPHDGLVERLKVQKVPDEMESHELAQADFEHGYEMCVLDGRHAAAAIASLQAELAEAREALVQHNDRLRSAQMIASRDGADTNWMTFRGQVAYTLAEYHELVNECRQALEATNAE